MFCRRAAPLALVSSLLLLTRSALAEPPRAPAAQATSTPAASTPADQKAQAEEHFQKARTLYQEGRYAEARTELLEARRLDPQGKDLLFNLGIVAEKMQQYDEAITYLREYKAMDTVTEAEAQRADASIRRIEGARAHGPKPTTAGPAQPKPPPPLAPSKPVHGRVDALTITGLGVTGAALATGAVFGVLALTTNPDSGVRTGDSLPWSQVNDDNSRAQTFGLVADIGLGVGIAAAATTAILYFARTKDAPASKSAFVPGAWRVSF